MPRAAFTQATLQRTVTALEGMGKRVRGVEVRRDGSFVVLLDSGEGSPDTPAPSNREMPSCDEVFGCGT